MVPIGRVGNQSPLPLIDLRNAIGSEENGWESVTSPFDRLTEPYSMGLPQLGISHLSL